jgi:four helix bundle protein
MALVKEVYLVTAELPNEEKFGLLSQIRRCAVSIPSNIAEGAGRNNKNEFYQFLGLRLAQLMNYKLNYNY